MSTGELQEQQTISVCHGRGGGGLYLIYFIFLMPFEAALNDWLWLG